LLVLLHDLLVAVPLCRSALLVAIDETLVLLLVALLVAEHRCPSFPCLMSRCVGTPAKTAQVLCRADARPVCYGGLRKGEPGGGLCVAMALSRTRCIDICTQEAIAPDDGEFSALG